jgi:shikimate kinase
MKKANPLLAAMKSKEPEPVAAPEASVASVLARDAKPAMKRAGQKHLGAYFDKRDPILERVALLRARLDMTNSELIEHALNEMWKRHQADRSFNE